MSEFLKPFVPTQKMRNEGVLFVDAHPDDTQGLHTAMLKCLC